ncbi:DUF1702 family protein [Sphaerisporangium sp. TRM90804]|uniref:DUF1702 family protein n=1 Tax=Sphaerisporangium sp. TRM90804 TaxID=3031113 RepID=UPI00244C01BC|nr:DUF1702 family protein [Sphaerisporangium sp. TRM90804]MDH2428364.1 DUF1702 family protein [Sphaerisporangium sp. TRM90804]
MASALRALRRRILTPDTSETKLSVRGFYEKNAEARELLETVGETFLAGYAYAVEARTIEEAEERLEQVPTQFRGFAYEGAGMGFAVMDALPFSSGRNVRDCLAGRGGEHIYMVYVGVGWAMARLPKFLWSKMYAPDPLLRWLALDGYGFHQAYFHTAKYVDGQYQDPDFPWPKDAPGWYPNHAIDQGIGRALWFIGGTDPDRVTALIRKFPESRHADLYAGTGLAASYACGAPEEELVSFRDDAGVYRPNLAQGSVFAAEARVRAGLVVPHTLTATRVFCGVTPEEAAGISAEARPDQPDQGGVPAYELWRQRIADRIVSLGGVSP